MKPSNEKLAKIVMKAKSEALESIENAKAAINPLLKRIMDDLHEIQEILEKKNCYSFSVEEWVEKLDELDRAIFEFYLNDDIKNKQTKWDGKIPFGM